MNNASISMNDNQTVILAFVLAYDNLINSMLCFDIIDDEDFDYFAKGEKNWVNISFEAATRLGFLPGYNLQGTSMKE